MLQVLEGGARWEVSVPPHVAALLGPESIGVVQEPKHMQVRRKDPGGLFSNCENPRFFNHVPLNLN